MLWKVTCCAEGDDHGSLDSLPVQAKLVELVSIICEQDLGSGINLPANCQLLMAMQYSPFAPFLDNL